MKKPNVLYIMCDQLRADSIAKMGNDIVKTPNLDRLAKRGIMFRNAYSSCPVCIPARYNIRTGREPYNTGSYLNSGHHVVDGQLDDIEDRCGKYLARNMKELGYRTFGIGKFHTVPWNEDIGYELQLNTFENWTPEQRKKDAFASYINNNHPEYKHIEQLHGERTDMYYMPQTSAFSFELTVEGWVANRAIEQLEVEDERPFFGLVSFIGPHPPFAPPIPYNRMYNPDKMPNPIKGDIGNDHLDEQIPWMNHMIWADEINDFLARSLKARYYGEITYIDDCIGKILDALEKREDANNTLICFFSDHGDHLGDHNAWQKESYFQSSCNVPFLLSWPNKIEANQIREELVSLTDLFGIASKTAGESEFRDGIDVLGMILDNKPKRKYLFGFYEVPGGNHYKVMVRNNEWKYIYMANGGREQLFNLKKDPLELKNMATDKPEILNELKSEAIKEMKKHVALKPALENDNIKKFEFKERGKKRIHQFDRSKGITDFIY